MKRSFAPQILTATRVGHQENPDTETWTLTLNSIVREKAQKISPSRNEELVKIFIHATRIEAGFCDLGYARV
jgi:thiaminase